MLVTPVMACLITPVALLSRATPNRKKCNGQWTASRAMRRALVVEVRATNACHAGHGAPHYARGIAITSESKLQNESAMANGLRGRFSCWHWRPLDTRCNFIHGPPPWRGMHAGWRSNGLELHLRMAVHQSDERIDEN
jgi:hypothetical protein